MSEQQGAESISPSVEEQEANYLAGTELPEGMPADLKELWQERLDRVREIRGF